MHHKIRDDDARSERGLRTEPEDSVEIMTVREHGFGAMADDPGKSREGVTRNARTAGFGTSDDPRGSATRKTQCDAHAAGFDVTCRKGKTTVRCAPVVDGVSEVTRIDDEGRSEIAWSVLDHAEEVAIGTPQLLAERRTDAVELGNRGNRQYHDSGVCVWSLDPTKWFGWRDSRASYGGAPEAEGNLNDYNPEQSSYVIVPRVSMARLVKR